MELRKQIEKAYYNTRLSKIFDDHETYDWRYMVLKLYGRPYDVVIYFVRISWLKDVRVSKFWTMVVVLGYIQYI